MSTTGWVMLGVVGIIVGFIIVAVLNSRPPGAGSRIGQHGWWAIPLVALIVFLVVVGGAISYFGEMPARQGGRAATGETQRRDQASNDVEGPLAAPVIRTGASMSLTWVKLPVTEMNLDEEICKPELEEREDPEEKKADPVSEARKEIGVDEASRSNDSKVVSKRTMTCSVVYYDSRRFDFDCNYQRGYGKVIFDWNRSQSTGFWKQPGMKESGEWFLTEISPNRFAGWLQSPNGEQFSLYVEAR